MKVGTEIRIINAGHGALGCNGAIGVITAEKRTNGISALTPGYNVRLAGGEIWRIHIDATVNILSNGIVEIKNVIFNDSATVVIWNDGTKTVVKCQPGDTYSKETGLALCIAKKYFGNKGNFNEVFKKWISKETEPVEEDAKTGVIKVGDTVRVIDSGYRYPDYKPWIERNVTKPTDARKWDRDTRLLDGDIGVVKYLAPHGKHCDRDIAYIEIKNKCHMIDVEGIVKV